MSAESGALDPEDLCSEQNNSSALDTRAFGFLKTRFSLLTEIHKRKLANNLKKVGTENSLLFFLAIMSHKTALHLKNLDHISSAFEENAILRVL